MHTESVASTAKQSERSIQFASFLFWFRKKKRGRKGSVEGKEGEKEEDVKQILQKSSFFF
jgi:hypothetical protein